MRNYKWSQAHNYISETGGHSPSCFSQTFAETVPIESGKTRLLDIGCGSGIIGIFCLIEKRAAYVTFNDKSEEMISTTQTNVTKKIEQREIRSSQVEFIRACFARIPTSVISQHDLLAFNPPQLPDKYLREVETSPTTKLYRDGGSDGLEVAREFLRWYAGLTTPTPPAVILLSSFLGWSTIVDAIQKNKLKYKPIMRTRVPLRQFLWKKAEILSKNEKDKIDRSLMKGPDGNWTKELVTILLTHDS